MYFGARYYHSEIGRWLAVDPLAGKYPSVSPYIYANNNPIVLKDVNGEYWISALEGQLAVLRYPVSVAYGAYGFEWVPLAGGIANLFRRYGFNDYNVSGGDIGLGFLGGKSLKFIGNTFRAFAKGEKLSDSVLLSAGLSSAITPFDRAAGAINGADLISQSIRDVHIFALAEALGYGEQQFGGAFGVFVPDEAFLEDFPTRKDIEGQFEILNDFFKLSRKEFINLHGEEGYKKLRESQLRIEREREFEETFEEFTRGGR